MTEARPLPRITGRLKIRVWPSASCTRAGIAFACAALAMIRIWDAFHEYTLQKRLKEAASWEKPTLHPEDLVGTWLGRESWGTTYTIIRKSDGTFSKTYDFRLADVPRKPSSFKGSGYWALSGSEYVYYYTKGAESDSVEHRPCVRTITTVSPREFSVL